LSGCHNRDPCMGRVVAFDHLGGKVCLKTCNF